MTTFREYVFGIKLPSLQLPKLSTNNPNWIAKYYLSSLGIGSLLACGLGFSISDFLSWSSDWFMLLWVGILPLALYANYCAKKYNGELK